MKFPMRLRSGRGGRDLGAAAVEFALVVPILLLLVMGILDYGRFFFDSVSLRQGAREGARQAVVQQYPGKVSGAATLCGSLLTTGAKIACSTKAASDITIGTPLVNIPTVTGGWAQGKQLLVCMQSKEQGTGFVPFPAGGILKSKVYMSIEKGTSTDYTYNSDLAGPIGSDWTWCS